jgi:hypothetical protein
MPDNRRNLQVRQPGIEGYDPSDKNGWPVPLSDPGSALKVVVHSGMRGETKDFQAMKTSRQNDVSLPEGHSKVRGVSRDEISIKVKKTVGNSLA